MANAEIEDRDWFQLHAEWADWDVEEDPGFAPEAVALMREVRPVTEEETNPNLTAAAYRLLRKLMRVQDIVLGVPGSFKRA